MDATPDDSHRGSTSIPLLKKPPHADPPLEQLLPQYKPTIGWALQLLQQLPLLFIQPFAHTSVAAM
jgi:hypothetical protein